MSFAAPDATPEPPTPTERFAFLIGLGLFAVLLLATDFVPVLDHFNLAMHEAGHVLFAILGATASLYGGTVMQFVFPLATALHFRRRGQPLAMAAMVAWGLQNLQYVALYLGDARARALPLVGGGDHDWHRILSRWGLLAWDTRLAMLLELASWIGLVVLAIRTARVGRPPRYRARHQSARRTKPSTIDMTGT